MEWNVLVVDDDPEIVDLVVELISENKIMSAPDGITCTRETSFESAIASMRTSRFDLIVLDLKDEVADAEAAHDHEFSGERVLAALRKIRFMPVIFHSGYPHKVQALKSPFVRIVEKGNNEDLRRQIAAVFQTKLPSLVRHIEEQQRSYLWDHVEEHWPDNEDINQDNELAYLVARRLGVALSSESIRKFVSPENPDKFIRPVELYVWPPIDGQILFGDILKNVDSGGYQIVLTPSCDCVNGKAQRVLLADCLNAKDQHEYVSAFSEKKEGAEISNNKKKDILALIKDNRSLKGFQSERFKFLPGTMFLPDLLVDFQELSRVDMAYLLDEGRYVRVATLDSPFAEALQNRFSQYYGRIGTPDLHAEMVLNRLIA